MNYERLVMLNIKKNFAEDKCSWKSFDKNISSDYDWTKFSSEI